jgi:hypothetical protein
MISHICYVCVCVSHRSGPLHELHCSVFVEEIMQTLHPPVKVLLRFPTGQTGSARGTLQTDYWFCSWNHSYYCFLLHCWSDWFCLWNHTNRPYVSSPSRVRLVLLVEPFRQGMCIIPFPTGQTGSARGTLQTDYWFCSWNHADYCFPPPLLVRLVLLVEPFKRAMCIIPFSIGQTGSVHGTLQTGHMYHPLPDRSDWFCSWNPSDRACVSSPSRPVRLVLFVEPFTQGMCIIISPTGQTGSARGTLQTGHVYHPLPDRVTPQGQILAHWKFPF